MLSTESGILADLSMSYDDPTESGGHCRIGRSDSSITTESVDSVTLSPSSPVTSSKSCPAYTSMTPVSLYVNNKLIPITPSPTHKLLPMTEVLAFVLPKPLACVLVALVALALMFIAFLIQM